MSRPPDEPIVTDPIELSLLRHLLALPTAPFREEAIAVAVEEFAGSCGVKTSRDSAGNLLLRYRKGSGKTPWAIVAHMDHPGFVAQRQRGTKLRAEFRGWIREELVAQGRVVFFIPGGPVRARVVSVRRVDMGSLLTCLFDTTLEVAGGARVPPGTVGMWDLPAWRQRGDVVSARSCDDVAGTAAAVSAICRLAREGCEADVSVLLTRAEEFGMIGAAAACEAATVPRRARIISVEASKAQPQTPLGSGVVVRVGDSRSLFDSDLTSHLVSVANDLHAKDAAFRFSRNLMPGGVCEGSVFRAWGYAVAAVCLPLGNYHNQGKADHPLPERIHLADFASLVTLLAGVAGSDYNDASAREALQGLFQQRLQALGPRLKDDDA